MCLVNTFNCIDLRKCAHPKQLKNIKPQLFLQSFSCNFAQHVLQVIRGYMAIANRNNIFLGLGGVFAMFGGDVVKLGFVEDLRQIIVTPRDTFIILGPKSPLFIV